MFYCVYIIKKNSRVKQPVVYYRLLYSAVLLNDIYKVDRVRRGVGVGSGMGLWPSMRHWQKIRRKNSKGANQI